MAGQVLSCHELRRASAPLSGAGAAAAKGGRFNPVGVPALCLALTVESMFAELGFHFGHRFVPLTRCSYAIDIDDVIDLTTEPWRVA